MQPAPRNGRSAAAIPPTRELAAAAAAFHHELEGCKQSTDGVRWYRYGSLSSFEHFAAGFRGAGAQILPKPPAALRILDVGAGDGDAGLFLESLGCAVDFVENPKTNANGGEGLRYLVAARQSNARIYETDLDRSLDIPTGYDLALLLGVLYHLRNPLGCLLELALRCERMVCSTRVISCLPSGKYVGDEPIVYLWKRRETNDDPTNFWCPTPVGLRRMMTRAGWKVLDEFRTGAVDRSDPDLADERMFVYCRRVPGWRGLAVHHDF